MIEVFQVVFSILSFFADVCVALLIIAMFAYGWRLRVGNFLTLKIPGLLFKSKYRLDNKEED